MNPGDEHFKLIGTIVSIFGAVEYLLDDFVSKMAFKDQKIRNSGKLFRAN